VRDSSRSVALGVTRTSSADIPRHRVVAKDPQDVRLGTVRWAPLKSLWFLGMGLGALIGGAFTFSWVALLVFIGSTAAVLLLGHSLGNHRKLVHESFQCPQWLEYTLVYLGVQVGLAGPFGLLRQHELRDFAQRQPDCHEYLRHGRPASVDAWWQLNCELVLHQPPVVHIEPRIAQDRFFRFLERTWMAQQLPGALLLYAVGGWGFVWWGVCARVTAAVFGHWLIGYLAHNRGELVREVRGAAVQGRNVRFTSLLTMGECWHNNHHAFPGSAQLGLRPGEWDPGWWALQGLQRLGLIWDVRLPGDLPFRPEVVAVGTSHTASADRSHGVHHGLAV
jgi:fatty-acid desaturase